MSRACVRFTPSRDNRAEERANRSKEPHSESLKRSVDVGTASAFSSNSGDGATTGQLHQRGMFLQETDFCDGCFETAKIQLVTITRLDEARQQAKALEAQRAVVE